MNRSQFPVKTIPPDHQMHPPWQKCAQLHPRQQHQQYNCTLLSANHNWSQLIAHPTWPTFDQIMGRTPCQAPPITHHVKNGSHFHIIDSMASTQLKPIRVENRSPTSTSLDPKQTISPTWQQTIAQIKSQPPGSQYCVTLNTRSHTPALTSPLIINHPPPCQRTLCQKTDRTLIPTSYRSH